MIRRRPLPRPRPHPNNRLANARPRRKLSGVVQSVPSGFFPLAAAPPSAARSGGPARTDARLTSPRKTRVGGPRACPSGRLSRRGQRRAGIATGSRGCAYKTASGRQEWTARDPLAFAGGDLALYNYAHNDPLNYVDYAGTGPAYRATTAALAIVGGGLLLAGALAATAPATVAFLALSGVLGIGLGTANLANYQNPNPLPTSPGGIAALGAGNSPTAQNVGAAFDLATGLTPNGLEEAAQTVRNLSNGLGVLGAADKTATAYGLTPGSSPPGGNPSAPRLPALPAGRL